MSTTAEPSVLAEHEGLWALDKPSGWVVHAAMPDEPYCMLAWAKTAGLPHGLAPVHRLDRGTSGVVLFSADAALRAHMGVLLQTGRLAKQYFALVIGQSRRKGIVRKPIVEQRVPRPAITRWRNVEKLGGFSLLSVRPETGRKHQIRRHLHGIGLPIVGDDRYRPKRFVPVPAFPGRLWLHAAQIELPGGTRFESALPYELTRHIMALRATSHEPR